MKTTMKTNKWTKGPWYVDETNHNTTNEPTPERPSILAPDSGANEPWFITRIERGCPDAKANAQLISSAPELFEALEGMLQAFAWNAEQTAARMGEDALQNSVKLARAALKKARGET